MGLKSLFSRKQKDTAGVPEGTADPAAGAADEMPTLIQGVPVPGADGPQDQTFITAPADPGDQPPAPAPDGHPAPESQPPAGGEPAAAPPPPATPQRPGFRERGRLRRRLRYLREVRELGYRDLGGLVLDQHRFQRPNEELVAVKVEAIEGLDREMRAIEQALSQSTPYTELFIPGLSACPRCGALHGSDARFCPQCGLSFKGPRTVAGVGTPEGTPGAQAYPPDPGAPVFGATQAIPGQAPPPHPQAPQPTPYPPAPQAPVAPEPPQETEVRAPEPPASQ